MAEIPVPERGQPIDVGYIEKMARAINSITQSQAKFGYVTVDTNSAGPQNLISSEVKIVAGLVNVSKDSASQNTQGFYYSIPGNSFKYSPVVTATPVGVTGFASGEGATVLITSVTTSRIEGVVNFNTAGTAAVVVNLLIVGVPNQ
jgi:hypothetical protein